MAATLKGCASLLAGDIHCQIGFKLQGSGLNVSSSHRVYNG
jgi:hypothetical protein